MTLTSHDTKYETYISLLTHLNLPRRNQTLDILLDFDVNTAYVPLTTKFNTRVAADAVPDATLARVRGITQIQKTGAAKDAAAASGRVIFHRHISAGSCWNWLKTGHCRAQKCYVVWLDAYIIGIIRLTYYFWQDLNMREMFANVVSKQSTTKL